ncbi:hypothetical protein GW889_00860 [Candidatus Berkelbacteria bacterium]|uniref:Uncharacterized protein n=1 Tax=Candidatus Berkelbacteria bacterium CG10_big_fil_rev_8_21_14_0_10_43_14 TaxID=1974515 RepID=A0A2M6R9C6_9BACT|nr:hypothetical protein [Candidatus Berkelbacteria bacterium]OIP06456.1 MAG: hypothetical protein AUK41_02520 [Candidatus Berkelbacteria bacterium CG2_30_43_20]PIS07145.1 MAG: hypothetical protein COT79_00770 [Candidatus Berkelbacteria bacterium CG10_big_fil_rev_8_21_14_0_10_43_14]
MQLGIASFANALQPFGYIFAYHRWCLSRSREFRIHQGKSMRHLLLSVLFYFSAPCSSLSKVMIDLVGMRDIPHSLPRLVHVFFLNIYEHSALLLPMERLSKIGL